MWLCKCFTHASKILILTYSWLNSVVVWKADTYVQYMYSVQHKRCLMCNTHSIKETILKGTLVIIEYMAEMFMLKKKLFQECFCFVSSFCCYCLVVYIKSFWLLLRAFVDFLPRVKYNWRGFTPQYNLTSGIYGFTLHFCIGKHFLNCVVHNTNIIYHYNVYIFNCVVEYKRH